MKKDTNSKWVRADKRKGMIILERSGEDKLIHFIWKERSSSNKEIDLIIFPDDAVFKRVEECKTGRVYVLEFKTGNKVFFWMQEPEETNDEKNVEIINNNINSHSVSKNTSRSSKVSELVSNATSKIPSEKSSTQNSKMEKKSKLNLFDIVRASNVIPTGILNDEQIKNELQKYLPESEHNSVEDTLRSPQFEQTVEILDFALHQNKSAIFDLTASFGLQMPSSFKSSILETFLAAIQQNVDSKKNPDNQKMDIDPSSRL